VREEKIMMRAFTLEYWMDDGWYVGRLKEVPGVFSQGFSLQELEENIRDVYRLMMEEVAEALPHVGIQAKELLVEL
jgi:predicted RNase H-like HicB family nuclease